MQLIPYPKFRFLNLPAELRHWTYDYLFPSYKCLGSPYKLAATVGRKTQPAIEAMGAQVQAEIKELFVKRLQNLTLIPAERHGLFHGEQLESFGRTGRKSIEELAPDTFHAESLWQEIAVLYQIPAFALRMREAEEDTR